MHYSGKSSISTNSVMKQLNIMMLMKYVKNNQERAIFRIELQRKNGLPRTRVSN
uniref:Uncharacterized protein n=1 Tax=Arundo donax TaxID=35708 RepID=A0A0A9ATU4_ARUDO